MSETGILEVTGASIHYRIDGSEGAPWIVFSNSITTGLSVWDEQAAALSNRYRILRYDQRGHGQTSVPPGPCTFDHLGGDVQALLDHLRIETCTFVGLSMGVPTGLHLYAHHPERVERLVFCNGQAGTAPGGARGWEERIEQARRDGMEALAEATVRRWFSPDFIASGSAENIRRMIAATPLEGFVACARALQDYAFADVLQTIRVPTLLIVGKDDGKMPDTMRHMRAMIGGAALVEIPSAGHIPNVAQPELFNRALREFLDKGSTEGGESSDLQ
ncbi:3-oxoadipate enol-lactonase [Chelativorans sp. AA-79]|uniref:3-oxoadipate enol-lactonase n=1 Tax=Chelativorans sp. AA-79 TaxID=3028735 RepID=UPI0023F964F0|nr:3-oxoadipate enol-lactonase [Chelativorans sp. AA-79]WEX08717.1 3-oxoadipate enol-lactonase [Chelativorans sp. AA-79]